MDPVVSVIIPVPGAAPRLAGCVESVQSQTIDPDTVETLVVAVDPVTRGEWVGRRNIRVVPPLTDVGVLADEAALCNRGLDSARGRYVFFLDPDDRLGPFALERLHDMASGAGSDIVVPKTVPVVGPAPHHRLWTRDRESVDLFDSGVYDFLGRGKLFRRRFLTDLGIEFPSGWGAATDLPAVAGAYLHARTISVLAEHDCLLTDADGATAEDPVRFLGKVDSVAELVAAHVPSGTNRDRLLRRHIRDEVLTAAIVGHWFDDMTESGRRRLLGAAKRFCDRWMTLSVFDRLPPVYRVMAYCLRNNKVDDLTDVIRHHQFGTEPRAVVSDGLVYAGLPLFRNPAAAIPDRCYDMTAELTVRHDVHEVSWQGSRLAITGHAFIPHIDTDGQTVTIVLRDAGTGRQYRIPTQMTPTPRLSRELHGGIYDYGFAGFTARLDLDRIAGGAPLEDGRWDATIEVATHGVTARRRLAVPSGGALVAGRHRLVPIPGRPRIVTCQDSGEGALRLAVATAGASDADRVRLTRCHNGRTALEVLAHGQLTDWPSGSVAELCLVRGRTTRTIPALISPDDTGFGLTAALPAPRLSLSAGWWGMGVRLSWPGGHWEVPVRDTTGDQVWLRGRPSMRVLIGRAANVRA